jgi:hypothetical protein
VGNDVTVTEATPELQHALAELEKRQQESVATVERLTRAKTVRTHSFSLLVSLALF